MNEIQLEQIVRLYGADILRFCRITTGSRDEGDELYQDTMLTLLEKQQLLDADQNIRAYAITVALRLWKNQTRKWLRRLRLVPQESLEDLAEQGIQPSGSTTSPEDALLQKQQEQALRQLVAALPEKYRLPIQLYYSADLSVSAIAEVLNLPENTVKSRLRRGRETLRRQLEETEYERTGI